MIPKSKTQIVLDTNFMLSMLSQHRDLDDEIRIAVPGGIGIVLLDLVMLEVERLARQGSASAARWAKTALDFLHEREYPVIEHRPGPADVDAALTSFALSETIPTCVATIDRELRTALQSFGVPTISPMKRHRLILQGRGL